MFVINNPNTFAMQNESMEINKLLKFAMFTDKKRILTCFLQNTNKFYKLTLKYVSY